MRKLESGKWYRAGGDTILVVGHIEGNSKVTTIYHWWRSGPAEGYMGRHERELAQVCATGKYKTMARTWEEIPNPGGKFTVPGTAVVMPTQ
jgi:hypothetical protein